MKSLKK